MVNTRVDNYDDMESVQKRRTEEDYGNKMKLNVNRNLKKKKDTKL